MYLEQLRIFGWNQRDENLLLASLLTDDPLLLIRNHGCAKTHLGNKIAPVLVERWGKAQVRRTSVSFRLGKRVSLA